MVEISSYEHRVSDEGPAPAPLKDIPDWVQPGITVAAEISISGMQPFDVIGRVYRQGEDFSVGGFRLYSAGMRSKSLLGLRLIESVYKIAVELPRTLQRSVAGVFVGVDHGTVLIGEDILLTPDEADQLAAAVMAAALRAEEAPEYQTPNEPEGK